MTETREKRTIKETFSLILSYFSVNNQTIQYVIGFLIILDVILATVGFFLPEIWFYIFHGAPYIDPQGLLPRCAADWTAFALIQTLAFFRWKKHPVWLAMVAGVRLSDIFTDLAYLYFCNDITWFGKIALAGAGPGNLIVAVYLFYAYSKLKFAEAGL